MDSVVLLHGFTGSAASWGSTVLDGLSRCAGGVLPIDLPGHGSDRGRSDPEAFTLTAVLERIDASAPPRYDLIGYSLGGRLALHHALRAGDRVRRLVLESASPGLATEADRADRRRSDAALALRIEEHGVEAFVEEWEALPLFHTQRRLPDEVKRRHREGRLANDPHSLGAALRGLGTGSLPSVWDRLGEVEAEVLLLAGEFDDKFSDIARRMREGLPRAHVEVVRGAGHAIHLERPDAWLDRVCDFLGG